MIKKFLNYILVLMVFLSCFGFKAGAQNTQAFVKVDQTPIRIGDQTKLHLTVEQPAKEQVIFPKISDTLTGKIQVVNVGKQDTILDKNAPDKITVTQSVIITSFDEGSYVIPSFVFTTKSGVVKTDESVLTVQSVKVDTTKSIYDIKQPLAVSYSWMDWLRDNWGWVVFPLLAILLIGGLIYYWRKRAKNKPAVVVVKPVIPIHILALNQLNELRDKKLWQQDQVKQYYSELSDVIREYLEKRYVIKTQEKTTEEIFAGLKHADITADNKSTLQQLLVLADLVKFAKEKPLAIENEQSIEQAITFVLNTQKAEKPVSTEGKGNIEGGHAGEHI